jgi:ferredoxin
LCQWCVEHGGGKKWYLNTKNYITKELFDSKKEIQNAADMLFKDSERMFGIHVKNAFPHLNKPILVRIVGRKVRSILEKRERGQVLPLEEAKAILNNANMAALVPCVCRQSQLGITEAKYCLPFTYLIDYGKEWPDFTRGGINYISIEEAKEAVERASYKGYIISVYGFPVPFVGGICMCEYPSCMALKCRLDYGLDYVIRKAEFVVNHDIDKCTGCGKCVSKCQFGAITISRTIEKALFNIKECFGCGACTYACEQNAISLVPRGQVPAVKEEW